MSIDTLVLIASGILLIGAIAAIVLWRRSRSTKHGWQALAASGALVVGLVLFSPIPQHEPNARSLCVSRMSTLGRAMLMYAGDYDNKLPHADWSDTLTGYIGDLELACPDSEAVVAYSLNSNLLGKDIDVVDPEKLVVLFESDLGQNSLGDERNVVWRHKDSAYFLFADGHVSRFTPERLPELRWK